MMRSRFFLLFLLIAGVAVIAMLRGASPAASDFMDIEEMGRADVKERRDVAKEAKFRQILSEHTDVTEIPLSVFREHYDTIGAQAMLSVLDEDPLCHSEAHGLGRVIYEHNHDLPRSTEICRGKCSAGCVHGVLMGFIAEETSSDDITSDPTLEMLTPVLREKLAGLCEINAITDHTGIGNCYHAVGHALTNFANYDISASLALCNVFERYGSGAKYYCATGVYMERDIELGETDSKKGWQAPCNSLPYPAACFRYKLRRYFKLPKEYANGAAHCDTLSGKRRAGCFHGLGFGSYNMVYKDPRALNELCGNGSTEDKRMCIEGALGVINIVDRNISAQACEHYSAGSKELCFAVSGVSNFSMQRDFGRYAP